MGTTPIPTSDDMDEIIAKINKNETATTMSFNDKGWLQNSRPPLSVITSNNVLGAVISMTDGASSSMAVDVLTTYTPSSSNRQEAHSRNFLDTPTPMVSTMVSASNGSVNEVHVLHYLGATIVCIVANMQEQADPRQNTDATSPGGRSNPFGAKEVFQSAMFLAFMVNGQRYLAKVSKRD